MNVKIAPDEKTGLYEKAKGGTERMYEGVTSRLPQYLLDNFQIICSRVRDLEPKKKKILWFHDTWDDPENEHLKSEKSQARFDKFIFVSYYQFQTYHQAFGIPHSKSLVLRNCTIPFPKFNKIDPQIKLNMIYHTTPHRGLELLVPVFTHLAQKYPNIHLDVFSSFEIYGWPQRDKPYEKVFDICKNHPQITYHGTQPNSVVREYLQKAHLFPYPSIWPETSCIAAIEAMCAGVGIVCSDFAALPETTGGYAVMYRFQENVNDHANLFAYVLDDTIKKMSIGAMHGQLDFTKNWANSTYDWNARTNQWKELLESLK